MRGCEDEKMFYRPPLLEEPCAQTLSGIKKLADGNGEKILFSFYGLIKYDWARKVGHHCGGIEV